MDVETGEYFLDLETGELTVLSITHDVETGESEDYPMRKFKIPSYYYSKPNSKSKKPFRRPRRADPLESQLITAAIFLLPTIIFFHPILCFFLCITEIVLHDWFHKTNKKLKDTSVYFQSPLHGIVKEMCGRCKEENARVKIGKLQDLQHEKLKNCIKRVVT